MATSSRLLLAALVAAAASRAAAADGYSASGDASVIPLSARVQGGEPLYGGYDVFFAFENPALLARQPRKWEVAAGDLVLMGGDENLASVAAAWASRETPSGAFGAAVMASGFSMASFDEIDLAGRRTNVTVEPSIQIFGLAVMYQYSFFSMGALIEPASQSFGNLPASVTQGTDTQAKDPRFALSAAVALGRLELGGGLDACRVTDMRFGGAVRFGGAGFPAGSVGFDATLPGALKDMTVSTPDSVFPNMGSSDPSGSGTSRDFRGRAGVALDVHALVRVRAGIALDGDQSGLRGGFTVRWKAWSLDYAIGLDPTGIIGMDARHHVVVSWRAGGERKLPEGPRFLLETKERTIAVAGFEPQGVSANDAAIVSDMVRNRLVKEGTLSVVEKANMDRILAEQAFQQSGCTTSECAVKLGKVLNVRYLVVGSFGKLLDRYVVSLRVVDVETARVAYSDEAQATDVPGVQEAVTKLAATLTEAVKAK